MTEFEATTEPVDPAIAPVDEGGDSMGYAACMAEVQAILVELESNAVDIDRLAERVQRASELLRFCNQRLTAVRADVTEVVSHLNQAGDE